jgi:hypothetical protein
MSWREASRRGSWILVVAAGLTGCGSASLSPDSSCADWNSADINAHGAFIQQEIQDGLRGLNAFRGYAETGIDEYCANDPGANLGDVAKRVAAY